MNADKGVVELVSRQRPLSVVGPDQERGSAALGGPTRRSAGDGDGDGDGDGAGDAAAGGGAAVVAPFSVLMPMFSSRFLSPRMIEYRSSPRTGMRPRRGVAGIGGGVDCSCDCELSSRAAGRSPLVMVVVPIEPASFSTTRLGRSPTPRSRLWHPTRASTRAARKRLLVRMVRMLERRASPMPPKRKLIACGAFSLCF
jgi:hypothetical protein